MILPNMVEKAGIYIHYKGGKYEVITAKAKHSETGEKLVVYKNQNGETWVRPFEMFFSTVIVDGVELNRFQSVTALKHVAEAFESENSTATHNARLQESIVEKYKNNPVGFSMTSLVFKLREKCGNCDGDGLIQYYGDEGEPHYSSCHYCDGTGDNW
jgi:hypothetical protein